MARERCQDHQDTSRVSTEVVLEVNPPCPAISVDAMWIRDACPAKTHPIPNPGNQEQNKQLF